MVVNRLMVLDLHAVAADARVGVQGQRHIAHQVFDKLRVLVGALGDPLFVGPLEQGPDFARGVVFGKAHQFLPLDRRFQLGADRHRRALVVCAVVGNLLRAGAQALHRHRHFGPDHVAAAPRLGNPSALVVEQTVYARDRRALLQEERKPCLDAAFAGTQAFEHHGQALAQQGRVERCIERRQVVEPGHEARHVGALLLGGQGHVQIPHRCRRLHRAGHAQLQRVAHVFDADALDRQMAFVALALRVGNVQGLGRVGHGRDRCVTRASHQMRLPAALGPLPATGWGPVNSCCAPAPAGRRSAPRSTWRCRRRPGRSSPAAWPGRHAR